MVAPVIHINGHPGSGKLTIAKALQGMMPGARLLDNHTLLDPALVLFERTTPELRDLRETIRAVVFQAADQLDAELPLILTDALDDSDYAAALFFDHVVAFATRMQRPLYRVILDIDEAENIRRLQNPERRAKRKLIDPEILREGRAKVRILGAEDVDVQHIDVTHLTPNDAAKRILHQLEDLGAPDFPAKVV